MKNIGNTKNKLDDTFDKEDINRRILNYSALLQVPSNLTKDEALEKIRLKISNQSEVTIKPKIKQIKWMYYISSSAAVLLALFGLWNFIFHRADKDIVASKGQHTEYQLPDGSRVSLNADSKITFNKNNFNKSRNLSMEGEAFFHIQKGKAFIIKTKLADIKILGTSFNVFSRDNLFKVSCVTGKILVSAGAKSFVITPGESAGVANDSLFKTTEKNIKSIANWRNGEFYFQDTSLKLIFEEIERQFNVTFVLSKTNEQLKYTGGFTNKNLVDALDCVCIPMGLTYEIGRNSQIFIREKSQ